MLQLGSALLVLSPPTSQTLAPPLAWTALLATSQLALVPLNALAALLGSMLQLEPAPPALSPPTSLTQLPPPAWTALLAALVRAVIVGLVALNVLLASMLQ